MVSLKKISSVFTILLLLFSCKSNIKLNSEVTHKPVREVSLEEYKSVQLRDTDEQNPSLALGISISGGGSRAQYFGTGVLLGLEDIKNEETNFLSEIDYFSTVSGGCYGVGYYMAIKKNVLNDTGQSYNEFYFNRNDAFQDYIFKNANIWTLLNRRSYQKGKKPVADLLDYEVLQFDKNNPSNPNKFDTQMILGDFFIPKDDSQNPTLPIFVPNATIYSNGERFPFLPHIISDIKINESLNPNKEKIPATNGYNNGYSLPLKYGITASSAFPGALPDVRFGLKDDDRILILIDGGTNENLGYTTLFELLDEDKNPKDNKRALIIDCSGEGFVSKFSSNEKIRIPSLLTTSLFFTVQTKYVDQLDYMKRQKMAYNIPDKNSLIIGFNTIKKYLNQMESTSELESLKSNLKNTKDHHDNWYKHYLTFRNNLFQKFPDSFQEDESGQKILSSLDSDKFNLMNPSDVLFMYEYASQVDTKLKIYYEERQTLVLAGRFATHLKKKELHDLMTL